MRDDEEAHPSQSSYKKPTCMGRTFMVCQKGDEQSKTTLLNKTR